jgi:hypothetical protein
VLVLGGKMERNNDYDTAFPRVLFIILHIISSSSLFKNPLFRFTVAKKVVNNNHC